MQVRDLYGVVDYPMIKTLVFVCLYRPYGTFPVLAKVLADLERGDGTSAFRLATVLQLAGARRFQCASCDGIGLGEPIPDTTFEIQLAIVCTDGAVVPDSIDDARQYYEDLAKRSRWAEVWARVALGCQCVPGASKDCTITF